jgi:DNA repair/transcription protein MET18/MMS19
MSMTRGGSNFSKANSTTDCLNYSGDSLELLSSISAINPRHVEEQTLPLLFSLLPDKAPSRIAAGDRAKYWRILSALSRLCVQQELFETLVIRLSTKLDLICVPGTSLEGRDSDFEPTAAYAHAILTTLANTLRTKVDLQHTDIPKYMDRLVSRLFNLFIYSALLSEDISTMATDPRVIRIAAQIITLIVQTLPVQ